MYPGALGLAVDREVHLLGGEGSVDEELAARTMSGWRRYGKGRHPAGLNLGDCFTYALAERTGYPVLCTGDDFAATGISVLRPPAGNGEP